jgi:transmembrane sensor
MERFAILFEKHLRQELTPDEKLEFAGLLLEPSLQQQLNEMAAKVEACEGEGLSEGKRRELFAAITPVKRMWKRWMVAASLLAGLLAAGYFILIDKKKKHPDSIVVNTDVPAPVSNKATITLGNGKQIALMDASAGILDDQAGVLLRKLKDGQIIYEGNAYDVVYNTLTNPRGSMPIDMTLSDGSRVWLNAGSSIKYPVSFNDNERRVSMTGEAYFEIAHNASKPFIVEKDAVHVQVLGTKFNVNAYEDEDAMKVTLLEGSVQCAAGSGQSMVLEPGEQARIPYPVSRIAVSNDVNLEEVMAWKNGKFIFGQKTSIVAIMKQLARWYDVAVVYEGNMTYEFGGSLSRQMNVSQVLHLLQQAGGVHFEIKGRTIYVRP